MEFAVRVRGPGVTARTLARTLRGHGVAVRHDPSGAAAGWPILVPAPTASLLAQLWADPGMWARAQPIRRRLVDDGSAAPPALVPAPGWAIDPAALAARMGAGDDDGDPLPAGRAWVVECAPGARAMQRVGGQQAQWADATLAPGWPGDCCGFARRAGFWLFLLPVGGGRAALFGLADGPLPDPGSALAAVPALAAAVGTVAPWSRPADAMPRIAGRLARPGWLAAGQAAMALDPVAGDGLGHGLRGALLAARTLCAIRAGAAVAPALGRYRQTLRAAFEHHLASRDRQLTAPA